MTDIAQIQLIVANIEHEVARIKKALPNTEVLILEDAGERISSLGDMIRDSI